MNSLTKEKIEKNDNCKLNFEQKFLLGVLLVPLMRGVLLQRRRAFNAYSSVDAYNLIDIVAIFCLFFLCLKYTEKIKNIILETPVKWFFAYYSICAISFLWASRMDLMYTPYRAFEFMVVLFASCCVMSNFKDIKSAFLFLLWLTPVIGIICMANTFKNCGFSFISRAFHTNTASIPGLIAVLLAYGSYREKIFPFSTVKWPLILGIIIVVIGTSSATNIALIIGLATLWSISGKNFSYPRLILAGGIAWLLWHFFSDMLFEFIFPNKSVVSVSGASGRFEIWEACWKGFLKSPVYGYGFPMGDKEGQIYGWKQTTSTHNSFVSVLLNTGILGMIIWLCFLIGTWNQYLKHLQQDNRYAAVLFATFVAIVVNSCSTPILGSTFIGHSTEIMLLFAFSTIWLFHTEKTAEGKTP